ncbi:DUF2155 domain-containing protein [Rhodobacteraceae bacterium M382]|nr:DUF2155 domain-containing protein [Rhodobacteraceae bacterium M382]
MVSACLLACLCLTSGPGIAQEATKPATVGQGAVLRGLDKVNGKTADFELLNGATAEMLGLLVTLGECRYPADNPTGDAFAFLIIRDPESGQVQFEGWMVASSPALNALDHARYDIWVLRCMTS